MNREATIRRILETHLGGRVPAADLDAVARAIADLDRGWEEWEGIEEELGLHLSVQCSDICNLGQWIAEGHRVRIWREVIPSPEV
jgi:hypothetical protein